MSFSFFFSLQNIEKDLYEQTEQQNGGWIDYRDFKVDKKVKESDVITSFYLKPVDEKPIATYKAGQYLTIRADIEGETYSHVRHISWSDEPDKDYYRISVKREDGNEGAPVGIVSNYLHRDVKEREVLPVAAPAGGFTLESEDIPLVLLSGGIGLTPMISILKEVVQKQPNRSVVFIHGTINGDTHAMRDEVEKIAAPYESVTSYVCYEVQTKKERKTENYDKEEFMN